MNGRCTPPQHAFIQVIERAINGVPAAMMLAVIPERDSGSFRGLPPDRGDPADGDSPFRIGVQFLFSSWQLCRGWCLEVLVGRLVWSIGGILAGAVVAWGLSSSKPGARVWSFEYEGSFVHFSLLPDMGTVPVGGEPWKRGLSPRDADVPFSVCRDVYYERASEIAISVGRASASVQELKSVMATWRDP